MNLRTRLISMGGSALIAFMMSFSLTCTLLSAVTAECPWGMAALWCAAAVLVCALVALNKVTALIGAALAVGSLIFAAVGGSALITARINPLEALARAVETVSARSGGLVELRAEVMTLLVFLAALFGVVSMLMVRLSGGVYPAVLLFVFVLLGSWFLSQKAPALPLLPGLVALAVLYARSYRESGAILRALPAALIAAVLALALTPSGPVTWQPLQDAADKVREMFNDYFLFSDPRIVYSVSADGYQPRTDTLGGQATPRPDDVLVIRTEDSMLLRGAVSRTYTGRAWTDEAVNSRYLFADPTRQGRRSDAFDTDKLDRLQGLAHQTQAEVTFLGSGTSTLFVPHRLASLNTRIDLPAYYNETGEVFLTRGVEAGDTYTFSAWLIDADWAELAAAVNAAAGVHDAGWQTACDEYMSLPGSIDTDLYWMLMDLVEDADSPIDKALAIRSYLMGGEFAYSLDGRYPPTGRDFVSWFVLEEKKGYCTYFASAMAVMARLAGIPSRYAEGYRVRKGDGDTTLVTGQDAHAWAELYFNGVGWIAFDATPGQGAQGSDSSGGAGADAPETTPEPTTEPTPEPTDPPAAPNGPAGSEQPGPTPEPEPPEPSEAPGEGEPTPPPSEPEEGPKGEQEPPQNTGPLEKLLRRLWPALLLLLAVILLVYWRLKRTGPKYLASRQKDRRVQAMIWYRAILRLLARGGLTPVGGETPDQFAARAALSEGMPEELAGLAAAVSRMQYSGRQPDARAVQLGETVYRALLARMSRRERLAWAVDRMLHGIGNYAQIP